MATITSDTYLDDGTARTTGEIWTVNSGARLTVRTDTRWHSNSPANMSGSFAAQTINEGEIFYDGRSVRWLTYFDGSGNVPAIGTSVTQGSASGYLLAAYSGLTSAPTAIGSTMPSSGYLKFREVSGSYSSGILSGIGATASAADVNGWIEIVAEAASTITVPRLGKHTVSGEWFYLNDTDGTIGQVLQTPTNGGGSLTACPGVWIETGVSANVYEFWPALSGTANGWARQHLGAALGETDARQNFVKNIGNGQIQIGEASSLAATYANVAAQASTYASIAHSSTYTWTNDIVTITLAAGHLLKDGQQVHCDFTSGGATADGIYTVTVLDAYNYTIDLAGSGASGNVTVRPGHTITFTAHTLGVGDTVYCDFTSGAGVDGDYVIYAVTSANAYLIEAPHAATTSGNVSVHSRYAVTFVAHALAIGNRVYLDFTSGAGASGIYTIIAVPDANTFHVVANNNGAADSGNVNIKQTIGNIPTSGCKVRIPNVFLRECIAATKHLNAVNTAIASRPEWATTSAGAINLNRAYSTWYHNFAQPYLIRMRDTAALDSVIITECATALDIDNFSLGMFGGLDAVALTLTSNFAGGNISNAKFMRGNTPGTTDHSVSITTCDDIIFSNVDFGIIQFARSTGKAIVIAQCDGLSFISCRNYNSDLAISTCFNITITDWNHCDRFIGYTNATTAYYAFVLTAKCNNIIVDGLSFGLDGAVPNVHPYNGLFSVSASSNIKFRNAGSRTAILNGGNWRPNLYATGVLYVSGGNNNSVKLQRIYVDTQRTGIATTINSDKNITYESILGTRYIYSAMAPYLQINAQLNSIMKGFGFCVNTVTGQSSVYGNIFHDFFTGNSVGRLVLNFNETTTETSSQFTLVSGAAKFNSAGGVLMSAIGDQAIWEDSVFRKGHTGFQNTTPTMSGGTIGNYTLEYQIDLGAGYGGSWKTLSGANLSAEAVDPSVGFKIKIRITTTTTNTTAITFLRIDTTSSSTAQANNLYDLDVAELELTGLVSGSEIRCYQGNDPSTAIEIGAIESSGESFAFNHSSGGQSGYIIIHSLGYVPLKIDLTYSSSAQSIPVSQQIDRVYSNI